MQQNTKKINNMKHIAVITMARNDEFFLTRWINYYGNIFGNSNLYIILDGVDQQEPINATGVHINKLPHKNLSRAKGDKYRINILSNLAKGLLKTYDIVIGCDCDEFLIVDPNQKTNLIDYLSNANIKNTVSALGLDVGQNLNKESSLNIDNSILAQRNFALVSTRYTKPIIINTPVNWGSGFHSIKKHNFHIDKNLYLLHFGSVDLDMLKNKAIQRGKDWINHLKRRGNGTINAITKAKTIHTERIFPLVRFMQTYCRPIYSLRKPAMLGLTIVIQIPKRFKNTHI